MSWIFLAMLMAGLGGIGLGFRMARTRQQQAQQQAAPLRLLYELAEGDRLHVAAELERICETQPHEPRVFLALAAIDRERGRLERAKALHRVVLASAELRHEERVAGFVGLGRDLLAEGNVPAAVGALNRANSLAPSSPATLESLAVALDRAGAWEQSVTAWERLERQVSGRQARLARVGRGRALAGHGLEAKRDGEAEKARKLVARGLELAPDSGFVWLASARVETRASEALLAWQRAWELASSGAATVLDEAWLWAEQTGKQSQLVERIRASLRGTSDPTVVVALARSVAKHDAHLAQTALERVADASLRARWELTRLQAASTPDADARLRDVSIAFVCSACQKRSEAFAFRCADCGRWDTLTHGDGLASSGRKPTSTGSSLSA